MKLAKLLHTQIKDNFVSAQEQTLHFSDFLQIIVNF